MEKKEGNENNEERSEGIENWIEERRNQERRTNEVLKNGKEQ